MRTVLASALLLAAFGCGGKRIEQAQIADQAPAKDFGDQGRNVSQLGTFARGREPQLRFCYDEFGRRENPQLAGTVAVAVTVQASGDVRSVEVTSRSWKGRETSKVEECICSRIRSWKFPEYEGGEGTYPFTFVFTQ